MKLGLFCVLAVLVGAQSFESKPWSETGKWPVLTQAHSAYALPYPTPTPVGYTYNSLPYSSSYSIQKPFEGCSNQITDQDILEYRHAIYNLTIPVFKKAAQASEGHFVMSPYTMWLTMAVFAEAAPKPLQEEMFELLNLPVHDVCKRYQFYHLATNREHHTSDIVLGRQRFFIGDSSIHINKQWEDFAKEATHLDTKSVPFKSNPFVEIDSLKKVFKAHLPTIDLSGNSIIMESLDYHGLWANAFTDAVIQEGPFYNSVGQPIGNMEYMKMTKQANIGYVPGINMKVLDLPVGREGRYRMYFAVGIGKEDFGYAFDKIKHNLIIEATASLKQTSVPVDIVIPKLSMTSEIDVRYLLEEVGIKSLWTDPSATRNISDPAALPSAYVQRVTITLDNGGVHPSVQEYQNFVPAVPSFVPKGLGKPYYYSGPTTIYNSPEYLEYYERAFIADRPFLFGLFDTETYTPMFSASFTKLHTY